MPLRIWRHLKVWRRVSLGPVALLYRFDRSVKITRGGRLLHPESARQSASAQSSEAKPAHRPFALIVGVVPGFGYAHARHLAASGFDLQLVCRNAQHLL